MQLILGTAGSARGGTERLWYGTRAELRALIESMMLRGILLSCLTGVVLAGLVLSLGPKSLAIGFALVIVLPWLLTDTTRLFIWLLVTWPVLTLFLRIPLPGGIPDISYDRAVVLLLVGMTLIEALLLRGRLMKVTVMDILFILYAAAQIGTRISVIWFGGVGNPDLNGLLDTILVPMLLYWVAKNLFVTEARLRWFLFGLVIATVAVCPTGLYEQAVGVRIFKASISLGGTEVNYLWQDAQGGLRAAGALTNPAVYGAVLGMGSLAAMCCLSLAKRSLTRAALLAAIGLLLYGVFASYTRSAWLSVFVVLFAAQFFVNGLWKRTLPAFLVGLLLLTLIWNMIPSHANIMQRALTSKTVDQRMDLINIGWTRFLERPVMGWGSGALNIFGLMGEGNVSHNIYLTFLVDGGLVLFLSFLAVASYLLITSIRVYRRAKMNSLERAAVVAVTGNILIFLLSGMALELRYFPYINALFWISAGMLDLLRTRCNSEGIVDG